MFGLLTVIYRIFATELWPLIYFRISFWVNIFGTNGQNFTKPYIIIHIDKQDLGWVCYLSFFANLSQSYGP